jgi:hypothetical protein
MFIKKILFIKGCCLSKSLVTQCLGYVRNRTKQFICDVPQCMVRQHCCVYDSLSKRVIISIVQHVVERSPRDVLGRSHYVLDPLSVPCGSFLCQCQFASRQTYVRVNGEQKSPKLTCALSLWSQPPVLRRV